MVDLRPPRFEFRIMYLEDSVISLTSPISGGSLCPIKPVCAQTRPKARSISFFFEQGKTPHISRWFSRIRFRVSVGVFCSLYTGKKRFSDMVVT